MQDIVIIGSGPAGISAAVYALRAGCSVTIVSRDGGALEKTDRIENYYGFVEPLEGKTLLENGRAQAVRLGARLVEDEVVGMGFEDSLLATGLQETYKARAVILTTGATRVTPAIEGLQALEGAGVSYCAICDAFFYRGKDVAVLGAGEYALHEVQDLLPVVSSVTLLTNGAPAPAQANVTVDTRTIAALEGSPTLAQVRFTQGDPLPVSGLFVAQGVAGSDALARKIGALTQGNRITVNARMETNIAGLFAAGDCTGGLKQIVKAVHEGAVAGMSATQHVRQQAAR